MSEPWNIKIDDARAAETINLFVIFCEDEVSEPTYFESFSSASLKVVAKGNKKSGKLNLGNTVKECLDSGYMKFDQGGYKVNMVTDNLWCVYDRDLENTDLTQINQAANINWDLAIQSAQLAGLKVAWSNDAFELWVLLHFEEVDPGQAFHRDYIYGRLTNLFKGLEPASEAMKAFTAHQHFNYKGSFKRKSTFEEFVLPFLKSRTEVAIRRSLALSESFKNDLPYHQRNPCTMIHKLVLELLDNGGI